MVNLIERVYVRGDHNRVVELELTPATKVWWVTERALSAMGDPRDAGECRLLRRGRPLAAWRSLQAGGVRDGETLDLVSANTVPHHAHRPEKGRNPRQR